MAGDYKSPVTKPNLRIANPQERSIRIGDYKSPATKEKANLENELSSGTLSTDELLQKSNRISQLIEEIEEKTMRWLELSELA